MASTNLIPAPSRKQLRDFGVLVGMAFPVLLGWLLPALHQHPFRTWTLWIGLPTLILGLLSPQFLVKPYRAWMALGHGLGWINSHIILGLVFCFVVQPIALFMRLIGHDPLRRHRNNVNSYREVRGNPNINLTRIF